jgi:protein phosphatase
MREAITRAVGAEDELELDTVLVDVHEGDVYLLCSDGLTKELSFDEIRAIVAKKDPAKACDALITAALARGGRDNVTVVVAQAIASNSEAEVSN